MLQHGVVYTPFLCINGFKMEKKIELSVKNILYCRRWRYLRKSLKCVPPNIRPTRVCCTCVVSCSV